MPIAYIHMYLCISTDCILGLEKKKRKEKDTRQRKKKDIRK